MEPVFDVELPEFLLFDIDVLPDIEPPEFLLFDIMLPEFIEPEFIEPEFIEPEFIEPEFIEPEFIEPEFIEPEFIEPEFIEPEFIVPIFEFIFEFLFALPVLVLAASPQAIPKALTANTAERAKVFFILLKFSCLLQRLNYYSPTVF